MQEHPMARLAARLRSILAGGNRGIRFLGNLDTHRQHNPSLAKDTGKPTEALMNIALSLYHPDTVEQAVRTPE